MLTIEQATRAVEIVRRALKENNQSGCRLYQKAPQNRSHRALKFYNVASFYEGSNQQPWNQIEQQLKSAGIEYKVTQNQCVLSVHFKAPYKFDPNGVQ